MSTSRADLFNAPKEVAAYISNIMREFNSRLTTAFDSLEKAMKVPYDLSVEVTQAAFDTGAMHTMPNYKRENEPTLKKLIALDQTNAWPTYKLAIASLSPLVGLALLASVTVVPTIFHSSNSFIATINQMGHLVKYDLLSDDEKKDIYKKPFEKKRFIPYAAPGYILGVVAGAPILTIFAVGRMVSNNVKACAQTWLWVMRRLTSKLYFGALEREDDISDFLKYQNIKLATKIWRVGVGSPGALLGLVAGVICALSHHFYRGLKSFILDTAQSFLLGFRNAVNPLLPAEMKTDNLATLDNRKKRYKFGVGILGLLAGGLFGGISDLFIALGRVASNTVKAFGQTWLWLARLALPKNNFIPGMHDIAAAFKKDEKSADDYWRLAGGLPLGGIPGLLVGGITAGIILACRAIIPFATHNIKSFKLAYLNAIKPVLPAGIDAAIKDDRKKRYKFGVGIVGLLAGGLLGGISAPFIVLDRVVSNNLKAFGQTWLWLARLALPKNETLLEEMKDIKEASNADGENERAKYRWRFWSSFLLGIPAGLVAGSITAGHILASRGISKWLIETMTSYIFAYRKIVNPLLPIDMKVEIEKEERSNLDKGLGSIGLLLGGLFGGISNPFIALGRVASNTLKAFGQTWLWLVRLALPKNAGSEKFDKDTQDIAELFIKVGKNADDYWRLTAGLPLGGIPGLLVGGITAGIILTYRAIATVLENSFTSFMALSRSYINVGTGRALFEGVGADNRTNAQKWCGSLGYVLATVTVGIACALTFALRKAVPVLGTMIIVALSPAVLVAKLIAKGIRAARGVEGRFTKEERISEDTSFVRLRTLFSSLDSAGRLAGENQDGVCNTISEDDQTGDVNWKQFLGKCLRLNITSSTERYLNAVLKAIRGKDEDADLDTLLTGTANNFLTKIENNSDDFFDEEGTSADVYKRVERMTQAVNDYIVNGQYKMDELEKPQAYNTSRLFFHRKVDGERNMDHTSSVSLSSSSSSD